MDCIVTMEKYQFEQDREKGLLLIEKSAEENYRDAIEFLIEHSQDRGKLEIS